MAFYGCEFVFDGVSCHEMGLMVYDFGSNVQGDASFTSAGKIVSDSTSRRYDNFFYGLEQNEPMEYTLVFGANIESLDENEHIDRYEVEAIASWLTGHNSRKWLEIVQPDMDSFRYKCIISELRLITHGNMPWAFSCKVTCDSPFAYTHIDKKIIDIEGYREINYFNRSTYNGYYMPKLIIETSGGGSICIENESDGNRSFAFNELPTGNLTIVVDNQNQVIVEEKTGINMYPYFNYKFLRLRRGINKLKITGTCTIQIISEFPVNVGA